MRKEKEIDSIERRLNGYQSQILIRLQVMFSQKTDEQRHLVNDQLESLRSEGKALRNQTTSRLDELHQTISTLVDSLQSAPAQDGAYGSKEGPLAELGSSLSKFQAVTTSISRQNKLLKRLAFTSMYSRENNIENAESGTFEWMVDEEYQSADDQKGSSIESGEIETMIKREDYEQERKKQEALRIYTREKFLTWLNSGGHIFHISGKAGSGKSTLMKFLARSSRVKKELESWAGGRPLIFVRFFFWNSGDKAQMSLEGLYRSLLFETCRQIPNIMPQLFPEFWQSSNSGLAPICFDEVKEAFNQLIQEASSSKSYFCFFIDGLDEFEGDELDHWRLSQDLKSWTAQAENVKLCVGSRPHIPFIQSFANNLNHQISIHELTREDIFNFSVAMFEKDPNFDRVNDVYKDLVTEVVEASDGVFLWARLAMRSLLKSVGYQGSEKDLKRKLHLIPKGLDELFDQILGSIDPDDQLLSDQLFLLTTANFCPWQPVVQNAIVYSWLEDLDDPGFPHELQMRPCTETEINERLERTSCVLDRLSRGLLEMTRKRSHPRDGHNYFSYEVQFLHRSARDYIVNTREVQMRARLPDFDVYSGVSRLLLAEFKFARFTLHDIRPGVWRESGALRLAFDRLFDVMWAAHYNDGYDVPSGFLEEASHIVQHHTQTAESSTHLRPANEFPEPKGHIWGRNLHRVGRQWFTSRDSNHSPDFLCEVVYRGLRQFLSPELMGYLRQQNSTSGPNLLLVATQVKSFKFVQQLLHEGRTPGEMVPMEPIHTITDTENFVTIPAPKAIVSVWLIFLYRLVDGYLLACSTDDSEYRCLEEFLNQDVDQDVQFLAMDERVAFDLLEFLELAKPFNMEALRPKLSIKGTQEDRPEVTPISGHPIPYQRGRLSKVLEEIVATGKTSGHRAFEQYACLESVIASSERLDVPFAFRIT
ncbi:hypothetical protein N7536_000234 [Penicillium majusculum]|nr:hypothetical protein N7536_000234 [Penicillium majusculum]